MFLTVQLIPSGLVAYDGPITAVPPVVGTSAVPAVVLPPKPPIMKRDPFHATQRLAFVPVAMPNVGVAVLHVNILLL